MLESIAGCVALGLAGWAAYKSRPRRLNLDWTFLFQRALGVVTDPRDPRWSNLQYQLGTMLSWDDLHQPKFNSFLQRKCAHLICWGFDSQMAPILSVIPKIRYHDVTGDIESIAKQVQKSDRLLMVTYGKRTQTQLEMLHKYPGMRDRMFAFVAIDPEVDQEWISKNFTQKKMDAEANHAIPYLFLYNTDNRQPNQIIEEPPVPPTGWHSIQIIDLGKIPEQVSNDKLARALWVVLSKLL